MKIYNVIKTGILAAMVLLVISGIAMAAQDMNGRYFVKSESGILKAMLGVQHNFDKGFTTELSNGNLRALKVLGIETEPVQVYHITGKPSNPGKPPKQEGRTCYPSNQTPWGIKRVYNDSTITNTTGGLGINVAVLDTGVYKDHLDLKQRVEQCKDFTKGSRVKNSCSDGYGHGTHVAGTILADGGSDGKGIYGVAPQADLFAYKVCGDDGSCWTDDIATAIRYAADQGAEIVSMSLGGDSESPLIKDAIDYAVSKGVLVVAAAGNDGSSLGSIDYPGANQKVMAVAAINSSDYVANWSSRGINNGDWVIEEKEVEVAAPGISVESTFNDGCYKVWSGTSMATPHVAGLAAKFWASGIADLNKDNTTTASEVRTYIQGRANLTDITQGIHAEVGDDPASGFGLPTAP